MERNISFPDLKRAFLNLKKTDNPGLVANFFLPGLKSLITSISITGNLVI